MDRIINLLIYVQTTTNLSMAFRLQRICHRSLALANLQAVLENDVKTRNLAVCCVLCEDAGSIGVSPAVLWRLPERGIGVSLLYTLKRLFIFSQRLIAEKRGKLLDSWYPSSLRRSIYGGTFTPSPTLPRSTVQDSFRSLSALIDSHFNDN